MTETSNLCLPDVTLFGMTSKQYAASTEVAIELSSVRACFPRTIVFTEAADRTVFDWSDQVEPYQWPVPKDYADVSVQYIRAFIQLADMLETSHALSIQWDSWVCNPAAWTDDFLQYDFVGSPWGDGNVGNMGFCLVSKRLCQAIKGLGLQMTPADCHPCDRVVCTRHRTALEAQGIKFAPYDVAHRFAVESEEYTGQFGFHGGYTLQSVVRAGLHAVGGQWTGDIPKPRAPIIVEEQNLYDMLQRAATCAKQGHIDEADSLYRSILMMDRDQHEAARHYAQMLISTPRIAEAIPILEYSVSKETGHAWGAQLLAHTYSECGLRDRAGALYERAIALSPNMATAHWDYGRWLLGEGRFKEGFQEYRWGYNASHRRYRHPSPEWDGQPIPGKRLYVCGEQGLGDLILYSRFLRGLREVSGATIILEAHEQLIPLFEPDHLKGYPRALSRDYDEIVALDPSYAFRVPFDHWVNICSVPGALGIETWDDIGPDERAMQWDPDMTTRPGPLRVGLAWSGSPLNAIDRTRSIPFEALEPLLALEGIKFCSLQYGHPFPERENVFRPDLSTTDRLANKMLQLDCVVSVDTMAANLSCALGIPTHVMISRQSDFRWVYDGTTTPWWPTATVHRQQTLMDYSDQIEAVRQRLIQAAEAKNQ